MILIKVRDISESKLFVRRNNACKRNFIVKKIYKILVMILGLISIATVLGYLDV